MSFPDRIGQTLGNVKLVELLGQGAMGAVYRAEHTALHTPYAVKILHPEYSQDAIVAERFRREAMMCSQLRHPNIVFVTDFGMHPAVGLYLIMEYLTGQTLAQLIETEHAGLDLWRVLHMLRQLCSAFRMAHEAGVIHRDLKPENIFVLEGNAAQEQLKVLDFGIARLNAAEGGELTSQGQVIGTPAFMAPEQINGTTQISPKTDIYSLGVVAYTLVTGTIPFMANNPMEIMMMHLMQSPRPLALFRPELKGSWLEQLITEMLAKKPAERPESMEVIRQRLDYIQQELQERGITDAFSPGDGTPNLFQDFSNIEEQRRPSSAGIVVPQSSGSERYEGSGMFALSGIVQQLEQQPEEQSRLSHLYSLVPQLHKLAPDTFFLASWGSVMRDLIDATPNSPVFSQNLTHLAMLFESLLTSPQTSEDVVKVQSLIRQSLHELLQLTEKNKHISILGSFQHLAAHYLFPQDALPPWAQVQTSGTWNSIRNVLNTDVRDFFRRSKT